MKVHFEITEGEFMSVMQVAVKALESDERRERTQMAGRAADRLVSLADNVVNKAFNGWDLSDEMPGLGDVAEYGERNVSAAAKLLPLIMKLMSVDSDTDTPASTSSDEANEDAE